MRASSILCLGLLACGNGGKDKKTGIVPGGAPTGATTTGFTTSGGTTTPSGLQGSDVLQFDGKVPSNILFLSIDTLRKDHIGVYGGEDYTPFLDQLASEGVVIHDFQQCSSWTFGSVTCTLAGRTNIERGHIPRLSGNAANRPTVPQGTPFLASWLGDAGYYSAVVSANDWLSSRWGNTQGYVDEDKPGGLADAVKATGLRLLGEVLANGHQGPWLLHLHHMEPHANYNPPDEFVVGEDMLPPWPYGDLRDRRDHYGSRDIYQTYTSDEKALLEAHLRVLYAGEVRWIDDSLSTTFAELDAAGYLDDTLVVVWTDHGEAFWEHGYQTHAYTLHGEENDAGLIFWAKNIVPGTWDEPVASIDLVPTLLDLQGIPIPSEVTGVPIGEADPSRPIFTGVLAREGGLQAVTKDGYKLQYWWRYGRVEMWDRNVDPLETNNLAHHTDPKTIELWNLLKPQVEAMAPLVITDATGEPRPHWPYGLP